jgi:tetratricopeptide (TPR) repeat protein
VGKAIEYFDKALKMAQEIGDRRNEGACFGNLGVAHRDLGEVRKAIVYYEKALQIAQEIGDKRNESKWLNNLGIVLEDAKKYREALACYFLAIDICTQIEYPNLKTTESNLKELEEKLGKKEFEKLAAEVAPCAEEIVRKMLEETSE